MMNANANYVRSRLSLRRPQAESLEILQDLTDVLALEKNPDLTQELEKVRERYPTCVDFERDFVSLCFALATGVGKTRLMGAFISYLYREKGIKNYFVMAPNLTIYNKLITDFSQPTHPKYVFKGIGDFTTQAPRVVTGDNYEIDPEQLKDSKEVITSVPVWEDAQQKRRIEIDRIESDASRPQPVQHLL